MGERFNKIPAQVIAAFVILLGCLSLMFLLAFKEIPTNNKDVYNTLIGVVIGTCLPPVVSWLYGTTKQPQKPL